MAWWQRFLNVRKFPLLLIFIIVVYWFFGDYLFVRNDHKWVDVVIGYPNFDYLDTKREVAKDWGINYEYQTLGCAVSSYRIRQQRNRDLINNKYFKELKDRFGDDWRERFDEKVAEQYNIKQESASY